jgi:hypothetical protein
MWRALVGRAGAAGTVVFVVLQPRRIGNPAVWRLTSAERSWSIRRENHATAPTQIPIGVRFMAAVKLINEAVGAKGKNMHPDVKKVLDLLNQVKREQGGPLLTLPWMSGRDRRMVQAIHEFQKHHFAMSTGTIEPNNITIAKLYEVVHGTTPEGHPVTFGRTINHGLAAMQASLTAKIRDEIVKVASEEAMRPDGVKGVDAYGKQNETAAARLREYFTVFSERATLQPNHYFEGTPRKIAWCGIFAMWVVNEATRRCGGHYNGTFVWSKSLNRSGQPLAITPNGSQDGINLSTQSAVTYSKGDICLTKEMNVNEKWPTHHFIVAEDPAVAISEGRSLQTIEGNFPMNGVGARHSVTFHRRPVLNYVYFDLFQPPAM